MLTPGVRSKLSATTRTFQLLPCGSLKAAAWMCAAHVGSHDRMQVFHSFSHPVGCCDHDVHAKYETHRAPSSCMHDIVAVTVEWMRHVFVVLLTHRQTTIDTTRHRREECSERHLRTKAQECSHQQRSAARVEKGSQASGFSARASDSAKGYQVETEERRANAEAPVRCSVPRCRHS